MADHAEYFEPDTVARYVRECEALSDENLCIIPGLEYRCEREMHILGYGATALSQSTDPKEIIEHIDAQAAISVIAHPKNEFFPWIETGRHCSASAPCPPLRSKAGRRLRSSAPAAEALHACLLWTRLALEAAISATLCGVRRPIDGCARNSVDHSCGQVRWSQECLAVALQRNTARAPSDAIRENAGEFFRSLAPGEAGEDWVGPGRDHGPEIAKSQTTTNLLITGK